MKSIIDNYDLLCEGEQRIEWFRNRMPILKKAAELFTKEKTFAGKSIAICMHIEPKTAYWIEGLLSGGVQHIYLVGCVGTTKADTAAYLASLPNVTVFGKEKDTLDNQKTYLEKVMSQPIDLFLDNGASLILTYETIRPSWTIMGATEETRSGKVLIDTNNIKPNYPVIVIDDSPVKQLLENTIGVGISTVDGFMRTTSLLLGGKSVLVIGYGFCGSGIADKFSSLGANTLVFDIDPLAILKAKIDGHRVGLLEELIPEADVIITVTEQFDVVNQKHIPLFKTGMILANAGHYGLEINTVSLLRESDKVTFVRKGVQKITFKEKEIFLLHEAAPLNLAGADGNPVEIMDLGLGLQSYSARYIIQNSKKIDNKLIPVPKEIDRQLCVEMLKNSN